MGLYQLNLVIKHVHIISTTFLGLRTWSQAELSFQFEKYISIIYGKLFEFSNLSRKKRVNQQSIGNSSINQQSINNQSTINQQSINNQSTINQQPQDQSIHHNMHYPLVNVYKKLWKITMLSMGKSNILMVMFKFANCKRLPEATMEWTNGTLMEPTINHHFSIARVSKHTKNYGKSPFLMGKSTINHHFQ